MKWILFILIPVFIISCDSNKNNLDGTWYIDYYQRGKEEPYYLFKKSLIEFKDDYFLAIMIGDYSEEGFQKIIIDSIEYSLVNSVLKFENIEYYFNFMQDSIVLDPKKNTDRKMVLKKLDPSLKRDKIQGSYLTGSYHVSGENYNDTICFINDSLLVYTGEYNIESPVEKWGTAEYNEYQFFYMSQFMFPLTLIDYKLNGNIFLNYYFYKNEGLTLTPIDTIIKPHQLVGKWIETENSFLPPPQPPGLKKEELLYRLTFDKDSVLIKKNNMDLKLKWDITEDGKRIYFIDRILKDDGSWKIFLINDSIFTIKIKNRMSFDENIITFKKVK